MKTRVQTAASLALMLTATAAAFGQSTVTRGTPDSGAVLSVPARQVVVAPTDGFTIINGRLHVVQGGRISRLTRERALRVSPTGVVTGFDGRRYTIPPGHMLSMDGRVVPLLPPAVASGPVEQRQTVSLGSITNSAVGWSSVPDRGTRRVFPRNYTGSVNVQPDVDVGYAGADILPPVASFEPNGGGDYGASGSTYGPGIASPQVAPGQEVTRGRPVIPLNGVVVLNGGGYPGRGYSNQGDIGGEFGSVGPIGRGGEMNGYDGYGFQSGAGVGYGGNGGRGTSSAGTGPIGTRPGGPGYADLGSTGGSTSTRTAPIGSRPSATATAGSSANGHRGGFTRGGNSRGGGRSTR